ncbi:linker histone H1 and H5 family protein [Ancylostoma duodenale]|uniref:Linker histone H1 and H5 family protein n=1 Tax=Ancylostoma duodenale TaxID=51022 RepID=A0A0C2GKM8_9BILA|nr:linker histone H1 and H5 family protein [Ancylostoma duodenale]
MADVATAPAPAATAPTTSAKKSKAAKPKGEKKAKATPSHPVYGAMIKAAIKELKDRKGASKQAIFKFITQKYQVGDNEKQINARLRLALKKGVEKGLLKQASGTGAAGRFRLAEKTAEAPAKPKVAKKPKAEAGEKPKKAAAKPKTPKAKKEKSAKSPKKTAKPKAKSAKSPKKAATPKKAASKPKSAKKPAAKKAAPAKA